jgi:hypothetical protein
MKVREAIDRSLADEPQSVVKVYETDKLRTDLEEYVLTDQLARDFATIVERVVDAARPAGGGTDRVGVWISGFFGSGKSHFAKLAGHLLADTPVGRDTARALFKRHLHSGRLADERLQELLQEAANYRLACHPVPFDITAEHAPAAAQNVGLTFLRTFYKSLGLSSVIAFAERELELLTQGCYDEFLERYKQLSGVSWEEDKDLAIADALFAQCLTELLPQRFPSPELAHQSLKLAFDNVAKLSISDVVDRFLRWLDARQSRTPEHSWRLVFVADEVGAWAAGNRDRIEQLRALVETLGVNGRGRVWLIVTSQEKLSDVVQNVFADQGLLHRLEARFQTNVHLESSEVGTVIEDRVLRKKPSARPALERLWTERQEQVRDIAEPPGLELGASYPNAERDRFVKDYPFLPYQIPAAADIFGGMRGVKVSAGARSMIGVVFDATRELADRDLGAVVSWDRIFDSANRGNEFQDEQYLGSQGLTYLNSADRLVPNVPVRASRLLKTLWLVQKSSRIPRTPRNLARLLVDRLDVDVLQLEQDVSQTLEALAAADFVRQEVATSQWRFLSQDEVTVEKIVQRIASRDIRQTEIRDAVFKLYAQQLQSLFNGRITAGKSNTAFEYAVYLNDSPLKNDDAPVQLRVTLTGTQAARDAEEKSRVHLEEAVVYWIVESAPKIEERLRRALAIERLPDDEEYRQKGTESTKREAVKLEAEAGDLRRDAAADAERAFQSGTLLWAGQTQHLEAGPNGRNGRGAATVQTPRARIEAAIRDRIAVKYPRFAEGDREFKPANIEKLSAAPAGERAQLDRDLGLFSADGHVHGDNVLVNELSRYLMSSTKTSGQDIAERFAAAPFGWPADLLRYVAAAMFVDAKLSAIDRSGKRFDDPKAPAARALFGVAAFKTTRFEVEEESLTPQESATGWSLLKELGQPPVDGGEVALKEATVQLVADLKRRLSVLETAHEVGLPLPAEYDAIPTTLDAIDESGSRVKVVRALIAHADDLRGAAGALKWLGQFGADHGFSQYRRSQVLLTAALQAGVADDPQWGEGVTTARDEMQALKDQRRVLDEWEGAYRHYRLEVSKAFRAIYLPLREDLRRRVAEARAAVMNMTEFQQLSLTDRTTVRVEFLGEGKPLAEVSLPELRDEQQLLAANGVFNIAHLRTALAALDSQLSQAQARVIELRSDEQRRQGEQERVVVWKPSESFAGKRFTGEAEIDAAFDAEKERLKALVRQGKEVQVL